MVLFLVYRAWFCFPVLLPVFSRAVQIFKYRSRSVGPNARAAGSGVSRVRREQVGVRVSRACHHHTHRALEEQRLAISLIPECSDDMRSLTDPQTGEGVMQGGGHRGGGGRSCATCAGNLEM